MLMFFRHFSGTPWDICLGQAVCFPFIDPFSFKLALGGRYSHYSHFIGVDIKAQNA